MVERLHSNNKNKIRSLFFAKKLTESFIVFSLAVIVFGIILNLYIPTSSSVIPTSSSELLRCRSSNRCGGFNPAIYYSERNALISSMLISGITGTLIFTPLTLLLNFRIKRLQIIYIKQEFVENKDLIKFQRTSKKPVLPPKFN